ncbi:4Fe-4S dicluster domain-containing protein [Candidatus Bathyarchaeota archaeon]|nr:4Fe-4S dicluster domain-containing protein [Candidatus Bathyarchaeota archaeon]
MTEAMEIRVNEEGKEFRNRVLQTPGAEKLMHCYQCGTCTSDCPVAKRVPEFRPRNIARLAMYGQKERLLSGDLLWLCAGCYTCYERCPQEVHVSEIVSALRKLALEEGRLHPTIKALMDILSKMGYVYEIGEFENEMREEDGLPVAPQPDTKAVETIMRKTGLLGKVGGE